MVIQNIIIIIVVVVVVVDIAACCYIDTTNVLINSLQIELHEHRWSKIDAAVEEN